MRWHRAPYRARRVGVAAGARVRAVSEWQQSLPGMEWVAVQPCLRLEKSSNNLRGGLPCASEQAEF